MTLQAALGKLSPMEVSLTEQNDIVTKYLWFCMGTKSFLNGDLGTMQFAMWGFWRDFDTLVWHKNKKIIDIQHIYLNSLFWRTDSVLELRSLSEYWQEFLDLPSWLAWTLLVDSATCLCRELKKQAIYLWWYVVLHMSWGWVTDGWHTATSF